MTVQSKQNIKKAYLYAVNFIKKEGRLSEQSIRKLILDLKEIYSVETLDQRKRIAKQARISIEHEKEKTVSAKGEISKAYEKFAKDNKLTFAKKGSNKIANRNENLQIELKNPEKYFHVLKSFLPEREEDSPIISISTAFGRYLQKTTTSKRTFYYRTKNLTQKGHLILEFGLRPAYYSISEFGHSWLKSYLQFSRVVLANNKPHEDFPESENAARKSMGLSWKVSAPEKDNDSEPIGELPELIGHNITIIIPYTIDSYYYEGLERRANFFPISKHNNLRRYSIDKKLELLFSGGAELFRETVVIRLHEIRGNNSFVIASEIFDRVNFILTKLKELLIKVEFSNSLSWKFPCKIGRLYGIEFAMKNHHKVRLSEEYNDEFPKKFYTDDKQNWIMRDRSKRKNPDGSINTDPEFEIGGIDSVENTDMLYKDDVFTLQTKITKEKLFLIIEKHSEQFKEIWGVIDLFTANFAHIEPTLENLAKIIIKPDNLLTKIKNKFKKYSWRNST